MARILVIEDDSASLELMLYLLRCFGHEPLAAGDGESGLALARRERPDLILCDIQMPKLDGYGVVAQSKVDPRLNTIPCVAVTAFAMVGDQDRILAAGFDGYITKPIAPETFVREAEGFLRSRQHTAAGAEVKHAQPPQDALCKTPFAPSNHATILVVDNSPENSEFLRFLFECSGYRVVAVSSVQAAMAQAQPLPDLILSDFHLEGESGLDLIRLAKADPVLRLIPIIMISSTVWRRKEQLDALALGASKFILRPIEPEVLLAEVAAYLKQSTGPSPRPENQEQS